MASLFCFFGVVVTDVVVGVIVTDVVVAVIVTNVVVGAIITDVVVRVFLPVIVDGSPLRDRSQLSGNENTG